MDRVEKMGCRANGEVVFGAIRALGPDSMGYPDRWDVQGWFLEKEMGHPISYFGKYTLKEVPYAASNDTITKIQQAFQEIKHMAIDTWQEECRLAARRAMKEMIETRMHNSIDAHLDQIRVAIRPFGQGVSSTNLVRSVRGSRSRWHCNEA